MNDTSAETEAYLAERYRQLTPGQRIEMACGMWAAAVALARAGICAAEPSLTETDIRARLIRQLYGQELDAAVVERLSGIAPEAVQYLGRAELIRNKRASGRPPDLVDLDTIEPPAPGDH